MNTKHYFIDQIKVTIGVDNAETFTVTGSGAYEADRVIKKAISMAKESYPNLTYEAEIIIHENVDLEEYQRRMGQNPPWLGDVNL